jgi:AraC-like DNA-binding protein
MDLNYISPYIRVAMDSIVTPPWRITERVIFDYELLYIKEGNVKIVIEDVIYFGNPGDIFLFKPKERHSIEILGKEQLRQPHIHFDLLYKTDSPDVKVSFKALDKMTEEELRYFREDITSNEEIRLLNVISIRNKMYFEELLFEIIKEYSEKMPLYQISVKGLFIKLWTYIIRENNFVSNSEIFSNIEELNSIKEYLTFNVHKEITLNLLEKEFKLSKFHLSRLFKKAFGMTPIHYHQLIRIEKAKEMIQFSNMSITEISEIFKFKSINAFSRSFRNIEGVAPSFYRTRN